VRVIADDSIGGRKGRDPINVGRLPTGSDWDGERAGEFLIRPAYALRTRVGASFID
jgi:hypothetical protein